MPVSPRGSSWQAAVSYKGQRARADFPTREEAERWHADALAALMNGRAVPPSKRKASALAPGQTSLRDALARTLGDRWAGAKAADSVALKAKAALAFFGEGRAVETLTSADVIRYQSALKQAGDANGTVNRKLSALSAMMKQVAKDSGLTYTPPRFPERLAESDGRQAVLTAEQVQQVDATLRTAGDHETADMVSLLFWTGMRRGELRDLQWSWLVTTPQGSFFRLPSTHTKTSEARDIPLTPQALAIVARRKAEWEADKASGAMPYRHMKGAKVFPEIRTTHALRTFQRVCRMLGVEGDDICLHTLRHSCATHLLRHGATERQVMAWLGHSTMAMMVRYTRVMSTDLASLADRMGAP